MAEPTVRRRPGERRAEILAAATEAIATKGFRGTSLADIALTVGVSQPGLLHHFPSKEQLLLAVLEQRDQEDTALVDAIWAEPDKGFVESLLAVCAHNVERPEIVRLYAIMTAESIDPSHPAHEFFRGRYDRVRRRLTEHVRKDQVGGRLAPDLDPDEVAVDVLALMDGMQVQWLLDPSLDMCAALERHLRRLENPR